MVNDNDKSPPDEADHVWYFAYASHMNETALQNIIGPPAALEIATVVAENAWLSFDYCGIPFVEPAYASLIIQGVNDKAARVESTQSSSADEDTGYIRYIHDRCFPGIPFEAPGELPPHVEGVAYRITAEQMGALSESSGFTVAEVKCRRLKDAAGSSSMGQQGFSAYCLIAQEKYRKPCLMPTITSYAAVYRGALTHGFSLEYMRYLAQLRPYNLAYTSAKIRLAKAIFVAAILFPQFVLLYLPLVLAQRFIAGKVTSIDLDSMKLQASDVIRFNAIWAERFLFRPFVGRAGYVIDF